MFCCALRSVLAIFLVFTMGYGLAADPVIGLAISPGDVFVNGTRVPGNVNLFEGNTLETADTVSELRLHGGARMTLAAESRGKIYSDRLMLEKWNSSCLFIETGAPGRIGSRNWNCRCFPATSSAVSTLAGRPRSWLRRA
jgi:hypothetical protein